MPRTAYITALLVVTVVLCLTLNFSGIAVASFLDTITGSGSDENITVSANGFSSVNDAVDTTTADSDDYLGATTYAQSDNQKIIDLATDLTKGCTTDKQKAQAIFDYVQENYEYKYYYRTASSAVDMLGKKEGNGCDQSHLFVALCRAAGIETRYKRAMVSNAEGMGDGIPDNVERIYAQVKVDGQWLDADPADKRNTEIGKMAIVVTDDRETYSNYCNTNDTGIDLADRGSNLIGSVSGEPASIATVSFASGNTMLNVEFADGTTNVVNLGSIDITGKVQSVDFTKYKEIYTAKIHLTDDDQVWLNFDKSSDDSATISGFYTTDGQSYRITDSVIVDNGKKDGTVEAKTANIDISGNNNKDWMRSQIPTDLAKVAYLASSTKADQYQGNDVLTVHFGDDAYTYAVVDFAADNNIRESAKTFKLTEKDGVYTVNIALDNGDTITLDLKKKDANNATLSGSYTKNGSTYTLTSRVIPCSFVNEESKITVIDLYE